MSTFDFTNQSFKTAVAFVNGTGKHVFITGKAGTGKTTFLKYIREHSLKKMAVVAPTGVAAINAGGVTMHSFFQLPFGAFVPGGLQGWNSFENGINNRETLLKNQKLVTAKRNVIRELELLVIDEVSMVRADLLDAVDAVLRHVRRQPHLPFGGLQMVYIGDLFQLPPVVNRTEWEILQSHYASPFFFESKAIQQAPPVYIELKKIYRQSDDTFINLLNNIRHNCCTNDDLELLHSYYKPNFSPGKDDGYITLTSHNAKADSINLQELEKTPGKVKKFGADIKGDFSERAYPAERELHLKEGAQIMFIKNDKGEARRYYNGKLATIKRFEDDKIFVTLEKDGDEMELEQEVWHNIRYQYNKEEDEIDEEELGTFSQYPIRLAWAITIHKSQGLTFEKAVIDAGASFAPGQVYVALSRLTSLDGLVLLSKIPPGSISTDNRILSLSDNELTDDAVNELLESEQKVFMHRVLIKNFSLLRLMDEMDHHLEAYENRQIPDKEKSIAWATEMVQHAAAMHEVAEKFIKRLAYLIPLAEADEYKELHERTTSGAAYFIKEIEEKILQPLQQHITVVKVKSRIKKYVKELHNLELALQRKLQEIRQAEQLAIALFQKNDIQEWMQQMEAEKKHTDSIVEKIKEETAKPPKGESGRISLQMFKEGKAIADIAEERSLASSTIHGHLATFVLTGDVDVLDLVEEEKLKKILFEITDETTPGMVREKLGPDYSFAEIKAVFNFREYEKRIKVK